jgi:hypothetical protein
MKTENKTQPTPRPWKLAQGDYAATDKTENETIFVTGAEYSYKSEKDRANAALIVRAVNCHDELVAALDSLLNGQIGQISSDNIIKLDSLLKRAKGEL